MAIYGKSSQYTSHIRFHTAHQMTQAAWVFLKKEFLHTCHPLANP